MTNQEMKRYIMDVPALGVAIISSYKCPACQTKMISRPDITYMQDTDAVVCMHVCPNCGYHENKHAQ